jgi:hypothetical protein
VTISAANLINAAVLINSKEIVAKTAHLVKVVVAKVHLAVIINSFLK